MPIFTPRGLKVRFDPLFAFTLLARLDPAVPPLEVLRTTEAVENAPSLAGVVGAVLAIASDASPSTVFWATFGSVAIIGALIRNGVFVIPGLIPLSRVFSYLSGWGLFFVAVIAYAWATLGWRAALAYVAGRLAAGVVNGFLEMRHGRHFLKRVGYSFTGAEINFFAAYRLHAQASGKTTSLEVDPEEEEAGRACLLRFAVEHPDLAARFS